MAQESKEQSSTQSCNGISYQQLVADYEEVEAEEGGRIVAEASQFQQSAIYRSIASLSDTVLGSEIHILLHFALEKGYKHIQQINPVTNEVKNDPTTGKPITEIEEIEPKYYLAIQLIELARKKKRNFQISVDNLTALCNSLKKEIIDYLFKDLSVNPSKDGMRLMADETITECFLENAQWDLTIEALLRRGYVSAEFRQKYSQFTDKDLDPEIINKKKTITALLYLESARRHRGAARQKDLSSFSAKTEHTIKSLIIESLRTDQQQFIPYLQSNSSQTA